MAKDNEEDYRILPAINIEDIKNSEEYLNKLEEKNLISEDIFDESFSSIKEC